MAFDHFHASLRTGRSWTVYPLIAITIVLTRASTGHIALAVPNCERVPSRLHRTEALQVIPLLNLASGVPPTLVVSLDMFLAHPIAIASTSCSAIETVR
jgi:hypothetical protein